MIVQRRVMFQRGKPSFNRGSFWFHLFHLVTPMRFHNVNKTSTDVCSALHACLFYQNTGSIHSAVSHLLLSLKLMQSAHQSQTIKPSTPPWNTATLGIHHSQSSYRLALYWSLAWFNHRNSFNNKSRRFERHGVCLLASSCKDCAEVRVVAFQQN